MFKRSLYILGAITCTSSFAISSPELLSSTKDTEVTSSSGRLTRSDSLPKQHIKDMDDRYFEGYIQALLDMHYYEFKVLASVKGGEVSLYNLPPNQPMVNSITSFIKDVPGVKGIQIKDNSTLPAEQLKKEKDEAILANHSAIEGIWAPQGTVLYEPMIADPRKTCYSAGYRFNDKVISKRSVAVSLGDEWAFYRWKNVGPCKGDMQLGIEAGLWSVFDLKTRSGDWGDLINSDYYIGFPLTYAHDRWAYRARIYHVSCHVGDEAYESGRIKKGDRKNPSMEAVDFFCSHQLNDWLRVYGGLGYIARSDKTFKMKPWYFEYGAEARLFGKRDLYNRLHVQPFLACHIKQTQDHRWRPDYTAVLGLEWSKIQGIGKKVRTYLEYHHGFCLEGQFSRRKSSYYSVNISYGF
ncbi:MAG: hypothetical protein K0S74_697 [Chlamydiales bacterium]|nr:hypothetical protein [Chlamydiales bacterium]